MTLVCARRLFVCAANADAHGAPASTTVCAVPRCRIDDALCLVVSGACCQVDDSLCLAVSGACCQVDDSLCLADWQVFVAGVDCRVDDAPCLAGWQVFVAGAR